MTNEERRDLCDALRNTHPSRIMCKDAANEIERLHSENDWLRTALRAAQSARAADRGGPADYIPTGGAGNGA
jgi:hypothetical protein